MDAEDDDDVLETKPELGLEAQSSSDVSVHGQALPFITSSALPVVRAYEAVVAEELADQAARKTSLEQRGLSVITTSGALVTLLFGLGALSTRVHTTFQLTTSAKWSLAAALILLILAAVLALATNAPLKYDTVTTDALEKVFTSDLEKKDEARIRRRIARTRVKELADAKGKNTLKAQILFAALLSEILGVVAVAVTIWIVIAP